MKILVQLLLAFCLFSTFSYDSALAHIPNNNSSNIYIIQTQEYDELLEYLEEFIDGSKQFSYPVTSEDERALGQELLNKTFYQFKEIVELRGEPGITDKTFLYIKTEVFPRLNPITMGKKVLDLARKVGPRFAITVTAVEILENLTYVLAAYQPQFSFLIPVVFFHGYDAIGFTYIFGVPFAFERSGVFKRFGGLKQGPENFYKFLLGQKESLPLDWSVVVDFKKIHLSIEGKKTEIELVLLRKNIFERFISSKFSKLIFPRRTAQRETSNALSISDIEEIAKLLKVNLYPFRELKHTPSLYSRFLLEEVLTEPLGKRFIANKLKQQNDGVIYTEPLKDTSFNAALIMRSESVEDLELIGESPDVLALRLSWYILHEAEEIRESKETQKIDYALMRKIVSIANKDLKKIAETDHTGKLNSGFKSLYKSLNEVKELIRQFETKPKLCRDALLII